jgi:hypothetical protein
VADLDTTALRQECPSANYGVMSALSHDLSGLKTLIAACAVSGPRSFSWRKGQHPAAARKDDGIRLARSLEIIGHGCVPRSRKSRAFEPFDAPARRG